MHDLYMLRIFVKKLGSSGSGDFSTKTGDQEALIAASFLGMGVRVCYL